MKKNEDWMNRKWRPAMGWMYMTVCIFDFIIFPIIFAYFEYPRNGVAKDVLQQWQPITLQGAGFFHLAMGAVLGVAAWSRGKEKIVGVSGGYGGSSAFASESEYTSQKPTFFRAK